MLKKISSHHFLKKINSHFFLFLGAVFWLITSLTVAFPNETFNMDFNQIPKNYLQSRVSVFIPLLLGIDIIIGGVFIRSHQLTEWMTNKFYRYLAMLSIVIYVVCVSLIPELTSSIQNIETQVFLIALLCMAVIRYLSYGPPIGFKA